MRFLGKPLRFFILGDEKFVLIVNLFGLMVIKP